MRITVVDFLFVKKIRTLPATPVERFIGCQCSKAEYPNPVDIELTPASKRDACVVAFWHCAGATLHGHTAT